ncbi:MAG: efflux RND transporter permease subunit, partial [Deltaproteobacteria bacterium]|nr:efflux RND transporter permease subunit [Deltaproteobacteria bacterium]
AEIAAIIKQRSIEIPGGKIETESGHILLRVRDRRIWANEFARIPIITSPEGTLLYLENIADVEEGFEDSTRFATYNRMRSIQLRIARTGNQTPITVSAAAHDVMAEIEADLPPAVGWAFSSDRSRIYKQRLELLLKNGFLGLALVFFLLGIFLELKLAFWVTMGIPISFLGSLLFLPFFDVSINLVSMFAFIIALGIVVDDAIIAGENIYEYRQRGIPFIEAAIQGARDVAIPITFSILTNIAAFLPLAFVPGVMGKIWKVIPLVVITVFLLSWVEAMLILPSHLAHSRTGSRNPLFRLFGRWQQKFSRFATACINRFYGSALTKILRYKYFTIALLTAIFIITVGYIKSGRISLILMPRVESDRAVVTATVPFGSPISQINRVHDQLLDGLDRVVHKHGGDQLLEGVSSLVNENRIEINAYLTPPKIRPLSTKAVTRLWRREIGSIGGLKSIRYESDRGGPGSGAAISIELSHRNLHILDQASSHLAEKLEQFPAVKDVDDGYTPGKIQFDFKVNDLGKSLGLNTTEVGRQVRNAFQGIIALRQQRGSDEVTVRVRLPQDQRRSGYDIESLLISTVAGTFVNLNEIATVEQGRAYTSISRRDGRRTVMVSANVDPIGQSPRILATLNGEILPDLATSFPGLHYSYEGRQADRKESLTQLGQGFIITLGLIYFLLAIPFRSYTQPVIVMFAIPFGAVGAVAGHLLMGYNLSLMSMMGIVALSGIVVNDSLVLIDYANRQRIKGASPAEAIRLAGLRRFRPVLLTTLTTFGGLAPMMLETSRQARFLIPMALSLGFGILFATVITLALIPSLYLVVEEIKEILRIS